MSTIEEEVMNKKLSTTHDTQSKVDEAIHFDDTAKQLEALKALIFNVTETNETKIQFIKEELSEGRYQIHSNRIAEKLLEYVMQSQQAELV